MTNPVKASGGNFKNLISAVHFFTFLIVAMAIASSSWGLAAINEFYEGMSDKQKEKYDEVKKYLGVCIAFVLVAYFAFVYFQYKGGSKYIIDKARSAASKVEQAASGQTQKAVENRVVAKAGTITAQRNAAAAPAPNTKSKWTSIM